MQQQKVGTHGCRIGRSYTMRDMLEELKLKVIELLNGKVPTLDSKMLVLTNEFLCSEDRFHHRVLARYVYIYVAYQYNHTYRSIAESLNRHHSTVMHALFEINDLIDGHYTLFNIYMRQVLPHFNLELKKIPPPHNRRKKVKA